MSALLRVTRALAWLAVSAASLLASSAPSARGETPAPFGIAAVAVGATLEPEVLAAQIESFVRARARTTIESVAIPDLAGFAATSASGEPLVLSLRTSAPEPLAGWVPITVTIADATGELERGVVTVEVRERTTVLVAARKLPRGAIVSADDVREAPADAASPVAGRVEDAASLVGLRTVRSVRAGAVWRSEWVERAPTVRRGEPVRVVFRSGGLRLELLGKAREDGHPGDRIRVLNPRSRSELIGQVGVDGAVHVGS